MTKHELFFSLGDSRREYIIHLLKYLHPLQTFFWERLINDKVSSFLSQFFNSFNSKSYIVKIFLYFHLFNGKI